jgi:hypothetical protein
MAHHHAQAIVLVETWEHLLDCRREAVERDRE